jgi:hypothetical protein
VSGYDLSRPDPSKPRGVFGGFCDTDGCPNVARWIPCAVIPTEPQPFRYRCPDCAERIDRAARGEAP